VWGSRAVKVAACVHASPPRLCAWVVGGSNSCESSVQQQQQHGQSGLP
jgi:hypothetical protein